MGDVEGPLLEEVFDDVRRGGRDRSCRLTSTQEKIPSVATTATDDPGHVTAVASTAINGQLSHG